VDCGEAGHAIIWGPNGETTLIPSIPPNSHAAPQPFEVNTLGQAVGFFDTSPGLGRAFLFVDGVTIDLGTLPAGNKSEAAAISESGIVCGYSAGSGQPISAFVWHNGQMAALNLPLGPNSVANDISDSGLICGWMGMAPHIDGHAFIYDLTSGKTIDAGISLAGAVGSQATGVNNLDTICGGSVIPCGKLCNILRGFIWSNGEIQDLGVLPDKIHTRPLAINDSNVVVGYCDPGGARAFVWRSGVMHALNDLISPGLNLNVRLAWDINNAGQIVGEATVIDSDGDRVAVRLTPIPSSIGDSDCDGDIDTDDLLGVINNWAHESPKGSKALPPCDFDHDGTVELDDLIIVIENWSNK
jgi:probable HAF family extracellular repeat protein